MNEPVNFRSTSYSIFTSVALICACLAGQAEAGSAAMSDGFEGKRLSTDKWSLIHMPERRHWIDEGVWRTGKHSLAIRIKGSDIDKRCNCQISEIREANARRMNFGDDIWYAFSFTIKGRGGVARDSRWQIAGWKQEADGSPFLAQRLDNGVFHITVESANSRVLVATARGKPESFMSAMGKRLMSQFGFLTQKEKYDGKDDLVLIYGHNPILPNPYKGWVDMVYHIRGGLHGDGLIEIYANRRFIARVRGTIGLKNATGPTQYFRFGHNRAAMPGTATLYFDNFRRGLTRAEVEKAFKSK